MTRTVSATLVALVASAAFAADTGVAHHPAPKDPIYVDKGWYETLKGALSPPPAAGSELQSSDERTLLELQTSRSEKDCEKARAEVQVSLKSFFGAPQGPLDNARVEKLAPFIEQARNDADYFIQRLKRDFPRKRPFLYVQGIAPCVPKEVTGAYPSGHAVLSKLFALILADLEPTLRGELESRALEIANRRVTAGVHHPTDIEAGRELARLIHRQLLKSPQYRADFARAAKSGSQTQSLPR